MEFQSARWLVRRWVMVFGIGALISVSLCWFAAWDEFQPSTSGVPMGLHGADPEWIGTGDHDEYRPAMLNVWTALTPASWSVGRRIWAEFPITAEHIPSNEHSGIGDSGDGKFWSVRWREGPGLSDSLNVIRQTTINAEPSSSLSSPRSLSPCCALLAFELPSRLDASAPDSPFPSALAARGVPAPHSFRTAREWHDPHLPDWARLTWSLPPDVRASWLRAPEDPTLLLTQGSADRDAGKHTWGIGTVVEEVRAYGWPLRCMVVRGWREDVTWYRGDFEIDSTTAWWSDGLGTTGPYTQAESWQLHLPATGFPRTILWLPFLGNTILLGALAAAAIFAYGRLECILASALLRLRA